MAEAVRTAFPTAAVLVPEGFEPFDGGAAGRQWFSVRGVTEDNRPERVAQAMPPLEAYVREAQARFSLLQSDTALAGFSQGSAMTLHTGLRLPEKLAGMMALSGYLPLADTAEAERHSANNATPIFMAHGQYDPVVSLARAEASLAELKRLGYDVRWHTYPMPHSVCAEEVRDISAFLNGVWG
ncbi:hypothetical protein G6F65_017148 [Rhizopus arrhizus]|nr:hypothetical protein G6F65_017148 [Rhizopus arrhizus]